MEHQAREREKFRNVRAEDLANDRAKAEEYYKKLDQDLNPPQNPNEKNLYTEMKAFEAAYNNINKNPQPHGIPPADAAKIKKMYPQIKDTFDKSVKVRDRVREVINNPENKELQGQLDYEIRQMQVALVRPMIAESTWEYGKNLDQLLRDAPHDPLARQTLEGRHKAMIESFKNIQNVSEMRQSLILTIEAADPEVARKMLDAVIDWLPPKVLKNIMKHVISKMPPEQFQSLKQNMGSIVLSSAIQQQPQQQRQPQPQATNPYAALLGSFIQTGMQIAAPIVVPFATQVLAANATKPQINAYIDNLQNPHDLARQILRNRAAISDKELQDAAVSTLVATPPEELQRLIFENLPNTQNWPHNPNDPNGAYAISAMQAKGCEEYTKENYK